MQSGTPRTAARTRSQRTSRANSITAAKSVAGAVRWRRSVSSVPICNSSRDLSSRTSCITCGGVGGGCERQQWRPLVGNSNHKAAHVARTDFLSIAPHTDTYLGRCPQLGVAPELHQIRALQNGAGVQHQHTPCRRRATGRSGSGEHVHTERWELERVKRE